MPCKPYRLELSPSGKNFFHLGPSFKKNIDKDLLITDELVLAGLNMHEMSLAKNIVQDLLTLMEREKLRCLESATLHVGALRQVEKSMLVFAFESLCKESPIEGTKLLIEYLPCKMHCRGCESTFEVQEQCYICPHCEGIDLEYIQGKELIIESIEGKR